MRKVAIVNISVVIDLEDEKSQSAREAIITDTLTGLLTEEMQLFNAGRGNLVDWAFTNGFIKITETADKESYTEDEVFSNQILK